MPARVQAKRHPVRDKAMPEYEMPEYEKRECMS